MPFAIGVDGLLGAALGFLAAAPRARGPATPRDLGAVLGLVSFPALAAALGIFANRMLLTGESFLSRKSLLADAAALVAAGLLARGVALLAARVLQRRGGAAAPRTGAALLAVSALAACALVPPRLTQQDGTRGLSPVVLVSLDTLRPDRLSGGGEPLPTSPHVDRICREGTLWAEAVTPSPGSAASHAALLTSRYPVSSGVWTNRSVLDPSVETLAERLRAAGYRTGGFVTNTFLGRRFGFHQGFDVYVESGTTEHLAEPSPAGLLQCLALVQIVDRIRYRVDPSHDPSFEAALDWLHESDRVPFLFLQLMDVHSPYVPPEAWAARFGASPDGGPGSPDHRNRFGWRPSVEAYLAEIAHVDAKIGRLRRALEKRGLLERTIFVLTSDHGEDLLDHEPHFTHGTTIFDSTLRVLAAVRAPGLPRAVDSRVFETVDVLPTIADLAGLSPSAEWEGRSFLQEDVLPVEPTFGQVNRNFCVRWRDAKVVLHHDGRRDAYRLDTDPGETSRLSGEDRLVARAETELEAWRSRYATPLYRGARVVPPEDLSPETRERLRGLGYLD